MVHSDAYQSAVRRLLKTPSQAAEDKVSQSVGWPVPASRPGSAYPR